jgi:23S rRNA U2552 (ribose-2'-O)-methylase RlmE/FtsJ
MKNDVVVEQVVVSIDMHVERGGWLRVAASRSSILAVPVAHADFLRGLCIALCGDAHSE